MFLKIRILRCLRRLYKILVSLMVTLFSKKILISTRYIHCFMPNSIKKSVTVSTVHARSHFRNSIFCFKLDLPATLWFLVLLKYNTFSMTQGRHGIFSAGKAAIVAGSSLPHRRCCHHFLFIKTQPRRPCDTIFF